MKRFSILLLINFLSLTIYAQTFVNYGALGPGGGGGTVKAYVKSAGSTTASNPYLFKSWDNNSTMTTHEGKIMLVPKVNYDVVNSRFVTKISTDSIFSFYNIDKVDVNNQSYETFGDKFYQVLFKNPQVALLKDYSLVEKKAMIHATTNTILKPAEFIIISKYYIILDDNELQEVKLNKKSILSVLNKNEKNIINFVKKSRLSYSKEEDAIDIFKFNALL